VSLSRQLTALILRTKHKQYTHPKHETKTEKPALVNITIYTSILYAFYDKWPGNRAGPIPTAPKKTEPTQGPLTAF